MVQSRRAPVFPSDLADYSYGHDVDDDADLSAEDSRVLARARLVETRDAFRHIFSTPQGELAFTYLYHFCGQGVTTHTQNATDAAFNEGKRRVYLQVAGFVQMTDEKIDALTQSQDRERTPQ